ncbi:hypothetical protein [Mycoplasma suis]|nr:hypothetical protein [Mycoplasma suis]
MWLGSFGSLGGGIGSGLGSLFNSEQQSTNVLTSQEVSPQGGLTQGPKVKENSQDSQQGQGAKQISPKSQNQQNISRNVNSPSPAPRGRTLTVFSSNSRTNQSSSSRTNSQQRSVRLIDTPRELKTQPSRRNGYLIREDDRVAEIYYDERGRTCTETTPRSRRESITIVCY